MAPDVGGGRVSEASTTRFSASYAGDLAGGRRRGQRLRHQTLEQASPLETRIRRNRRTEDTGKGSLCSRWAAADGLCCAAAAQTAAVSRSEQAWAAALAAADGLCFCAAATQKAAISRSVIFEIIFEFTDMLEQLNITLSAVQ
jgi:hypothetical protein